MALSVVSWSIRLKMSLVFVIGELLFERVVVLPSCEMKVCGLARIVQRDH